MADGWVSRLLSTTSQASWRGLTKCLSTARFITGSSALFTLFNCLTVPVYAVSLPILPTFIKMVELAFNKSAAFQLCQRARRWMPTSRTRPRGFLRASLLGPGTEARSVYTRGCVCTGGTLVRSHRSALLPCMSVSPPPPPPSARWFLPNISKWEASWSL